MKKHFRPENWDGWTRERKKKRPNDRQRKGKFVKLNKKVKFNFWLDFERVAKALQFDSVETHSKRFWKITSRYQVDRINLQVGLETVCGFDFIKLFCTNMYRLPGKLHSQSWNDDHEVKKWQKVFSASQCERCSAVITQVLIYSHFLLFSLFFSFSLSLSFSFSFSFFLSFALSFNPSFFSSLNRCQFNTGGRIKPQRSLWGRVLWVDLVKTKLGVCVRCKCWLVARVTVHRQSNRCFFVHNLKNGRRDEQTLTTKYLKETSISSHDLTKQNIFGII